MIRRLLISAGIGVGIVLVLSMFGAIALTFQWQYMFHEKTLFRINKWTGEVQAQQCEGDYFAPEARRYKTYGGLLYCLNKYHDIEGQKNNGRV